MLAQKLTLVIHSCEKFSDLWDAHAYLLNKNWHDRPCRTLLVTDEPSTREFDGIEVFSAGAGKELSARIAAVLPSIETEYVLVTLDDYFPIFPIQTERIEKLICAMERENLDYIRLFKRPNSKKRIPGYDTLYEVELNGKRDVHYQVNLYAGIWRKSFIEKTVEKERDPWNYELSLTRIARRDGLKCAMSKGGEFPILDVVRKGKLLHKANRYLKKHDLYHGPRTVISRKEEWRIGVLTFIKDHTPQSFVDWGKGILRKRGMHFYSDSCMEEEATPAEQEN